MLCIQIKLVKQTNMTVVSWSSCFRAKLLQIFFFCLKEYLYIDWPDLIADLWDSL